MRSYDAYNGKNDTSKTLRPSSSLNLQGQVLLPHRVTGTIKFVFLS
jgi:hypothetical protein